VAGAQHRLRELSRITEEGDISVLASPSATSVAGGSLHNIRLESGVCFAEPDASRASSRELGKLLGSSTHTRASSPGGLSPKGGHGQLPTPMEGAEEDGLGGDTEEGMEVKSDGEEEAGAKREEALVVGEVVEGQSPTAERGLPLLVVSPPPHRGSTYSQDGSPLLVAVNAVTADQVLHCLPAQALCDLPC
jgi:hypothetical protein